MWLSRIKKILETKIDNVRTSKQQIIEKINESKVENPNKITSKDIEYIKNNIRENSQQIIEKISNTKANISKELIDANSKMIKNIPEIPTIPTIPIQTLSGYYSKSISAMSSSAKIMKYSLIAISFGILLIGISYILEPIAKIYEVYNNNKINDKKINDKI